MSVAAEPAVSTRTEFEHERQCDCRITNFGHPQADCINPATWVYRMKCCAGSTFVCERCHAIILAAPRLPSWRCRWCRTLGMVSELVADMRRL